MPGPKDGCTDILNLHRQQFDNDELLLVMKSGIRAIACTEDALYFFVCHGHAFAMQITRSELVGWNLLHGDWIPDDRFPLAPHVLTSPDKITRQIARAVGELAVGREFYLAEWVHRCATTSALPLQGIGMINDFLGRLPEQDVLNHIIRGEYHCREGWAILQLVIRHREARELFFQNPALAFIVTELGTNGADVRELLRTPRRVIAGCYGFLETDATVRILAKLAPDLITADSLRQLGLALQDRTITKMLSHLVRINQAVTSLVFRCEYRPYLTGRLLQELAASGDTNIPEEIREIIAHKNDVPGFTCPVFRSVRHVQETYRRLIDDLLVEGWTVSPGPLPPPPLTGEDSRIVPITDFTDLRQESRLMRHCIVTYADSIRSGRRYVYRMKKPERATICIELDETGNRWRINDVRLARNAAPKPVTMDSVRQWLIERQANATFERQTDDSDLEELAKILAERRNIRYGQFAHQV